MHQEVHQYSPSNHQAFDQLEGKPRPLGAAQRSSPDRAREHSGPALQLGNAIMALEPLAHGVLEEMLPTSQVIV